ncbi:MAG TPA: hypothetical protein VGS19_20255 [Streptosporangiaceae bacterium]|nr:hypothetical protein [Streptosporangiaceae bacterium]
MKVAAAPWTQLLANVRPCALPAPFNRSTAGGLKPADPSYVQATMRRAGVTAARMSLQALAH